MVIRIGTVIGSFSFPGLYDINDNLYTPLIFGTCVCIFSWICGLFLIGLDFKFNNFEIRNYI
jgi:hypothetical protein